MITRHGEHGGGRGGWGGCIHWAVLATLAAPSAAIASDRRSLSTVTPDTLGMGEEVKVRWSYEDGNGGEKGKETSAVVVVVRYTNSVLTHKGSLCR